MDADDPVPVAATLTRSTSESPRRASGRRYGRGWGADDRIGTEHLTLGLLPATDGPRSAGSPSSA
jgi:hypothetical protein